MADFRWFQVVSGNFWVVSAGFCWFRVVPCFSKHSQALVLSPSQVAAINPVPGTIIEASIIITIHSKNDC